MVLLDVDPWLLFLDSESKYLSSVLLQVNLAPQLVCPLPYVSMYQCFRTCSATTIHTSARPIDTPASLSPGHSSWLMKTKTVGQVKTPLPFSWIHYRL